ncbi:MAG: hypothetical protein QNJ89_00365 [Acidimicrobiia bacterium]|nr:hypothetical protein [Acidimicrobiia bacterium]
MATYTTSRIITVAVLAIALGAPAQASTATTELPAPVFASEQDAAAYEQVQGLFTAAGFEAPAATIEFFDKEEGCGGARGRAWFDNTGIATIAICATHDNPEVEEAWRQRTLLHEMAHAWIDQNVSGENVEAFTELRGLETWSSRDVNWEERATEHAAEILMWGIQGGEYNVDFRIDGTSCTELAAGYELLTGLNVDCDGAAE